MITEEALSQNLFGFVSALIGGLVGGLFTMKATDKALRQETEKEARLEEKEVQNLLDALGVEVDALWSFHVRRIGKLIEELPSGGALEFYYPLTQDYFTVYNSNASKIGSVRDRELRTAIVVCYNKCKKVVDGFKYNNELYRDWRDQVDGGLETQAKQARAEAKHKLLVDYAQLVKEDHFELKGYVEQMLGLLEKRQ